MEEKVEKIVKKTFCPNGRVNSKYHFYVDPSKWNEEKLVPELKIGNYPLLIAPSQSGKTTRVGRLIEQLKTKFIPVCIDLLGLIGKVTKPEQFWELFIKDFTLQVRFLTEKTIPNLPSEPISLDILFNNKDNFKDLYYQGKDCILLLDEIDSLSALDKDTRQRFLSILRGMKQENISNFGSYSLFSVLGITNWVGEYIEDTIGGSPFNISSKITSPYFTKEEVYDLFEQYEKQENIKIDDQIIDDIFEETEGAQGLTVLFGRFFAKWREINQKIPSFTEWKNFTYGNQLFSYIRDESVNISKMIRLITESKESERCKSTLLLFLSRQFIERDYLTEVDILQRANILKRENGQLKIASRFIKKLLLYFISNEKITILQRLPFKERNIINIPFLIEKVIENINIFEFITGDKLKENKCLSNVFPGCKEIIYVEEFHRSLKICLSNFQSIIYGREKTIPKDDFQDLKSKKFEKLPQKAISCDTIIDFGEFGLYAIEHGVNLSLNKKPSEDTSSTLWHHVFKQGELYHFGLKAKETWVIDWTTVDNGKNTNQLPYWFPRSETVNVIYVYHSEDFSTFKIYYPDSNDPKIITKLDALNFEKLIISPKETKEENLKKRKIEGKSFNFFHLDEPKKEISSKIVYVKIGKDGKLRDLPALKEETFDELKKLIENEYPENETIKKGEFEVFDEEELPVSKDTSVKSLKEKSKLYIELKK